MKLKQKENEGREKNGEQGGREKEREECCNRLICSVVLIIQKSWRRHQSRWVYRFIGPFYDLSLDILQVHVFVLRAEVL